MRIPFTRGRLAVREAGRGRRLAVLAVAGIAIAASAFSFATGSQAAPRTQQQQAAALVGGQGAWPYPQLIINFSSNKCLQPQSLNANALIVQRTCAARDSIQQWLVVSRGSGRYALVNQASGMCMDLQVNSEAEVVPGVLVQQFFCSPDFTSENWFFTMGSRGQHYQTETGINGSLCLDVRNNSTSDSAVIQITGCAFINNSQQFRYLSA